MFAAATCGDKGPSRQKFCQTLLACSLAYQDDSGAETPFGRFMALLIGFIGILFTGMMVAILVYGVRESLEESRTHG